MSGIEKHRFNVSFEDLQTFIAVADQESFSRAARHLNLSQPAVSNRIKSLEERLTVRLLNRSTRKVSLTEDGTLLRRAATDALVELRDLFQAFTHKHASGGKTVDIAATATMAAVVLPPLIRDFNQSYADITIRLHDLKPHEAIDAVIAKGCDFAVMAYDDPRPNLSFRPILTDSCVAITPLKHPLLDFESVTIEQAVEFPIICPEVHLPIRRAIIAEMKERGLSAKFAPQADGVAPSVTLFAMAAAGFGILLFPKSVIPPEFLPTLGIRHLSNCSIVRTFGIVSAKKRPLSTSAKTFARFITAHFPEAGDPPAAKAPAERRIDRASM